jgi:hypothetical protein
MGGHTVVVDVQRPPPLVTDRHFTIRRRRLYLAVRITAVTVIGVAVVALFSCVNIAVAAYWNGNFYHTVRIAAVTVIGVAVVALFSWIGISVTTGRLCSASRIIETVLIIAVYICVAVIVHTVGAIFFSAYRCILILAG